MAFRIFFLDNKLYIFDSGCTKLVNVLGSPLCTLHVMICCSQEICQCLCPLPLCSLLSSHRMYALCIGQEVCGPTVSIPSPQDSHLPFHFRSQQMSTHLLSSSLDATWANRTTNGWNCICGERLSIFAGPHTQQFATHCQGKKHKVGIAPPSKAKRQLPMTQFFSAAAAPAPPADDDVPPPGEIEGEDELATSPEADGSALALGADLRAREGHLVCQMPMPCVGNTP